MERILTGTATQTSCPFPSLIEYPDPDRGDPYDAQCVGTITRNNIYGRGIVNALHAVL